MTDINVLSFCIKRSDESDLHCYKKKSKISQGYFFLSSWLF